MPAPDRTVFLTGGTGFVGSFVAEELLARGMRVRALVRSDPKWLAGMPVRIVRGDLHDADALEAGARDAGYVVHVAGLTRARTQAELDRANVRGTLNLLDAVDRVAPDVQRVLLTSSLEAHGPNRLLPAGTPVPADETDRLQPISMYGRSKQRMEEAVARAYPDLPVVVVRPSAVYGPRETDLLELVKTASKGLFPVVGARDVPRISLVHARDLARGMVDLLLAERAAGETYLLSQTAGSTWDEVRAALEAALGRSTLALPLPVAGVKLAGALAQGWGRLTGSLPPLTRDKAAAAPHAWTCDVTKARKHAGYHPTVGLEDGWAETVAWYREQGWI